MSYRDDEQALAARRATVLRELDRLAEEARARERMRVRAGFLRWELGAVDCEVHKGALPLLESVRPAARCPASWGAMQGDERVRRCGACEKNVYDLSGLTDDEADRLLRHHEGHRSAPTFARRADGTVLPGDCPVGVRRRRRGWVRWTVTGTLLGASLSVVPLAELVLEAPPAPRAVTSASASAQAPPPAASSPRR